MKVNAEMALYCQSEDADTVQVGKLRPSIVAGLAQDNSDSDWKS